MSVSLYVNNNYQNDLIYLYNGKYYNAVTLSPDQDSPSDLTKLLEWTDEQIRSIPSNPLYVLTYKKWIIFSAQADGSLAVVSQSGPINDDEVLVNATIFKLPDLENNFNELPRRDFPMNVFERFVFLVNNGMTIGQFNNAEPEVGVRPVSIERSFETALSEPGSPIYDGSASPIFESPPPSEPKVINQKSPEEDDIFKQSYETLMKQLYGFPVQLPSHLMGIPFIESFQADYLLKTKQIESYSIDPILQPWAGHPSSPIRIITLIDKNGNSYLVRD
jgi:hypothetical protein